MSSGITDGPYAGFQDRTLRPYKQDPVVLKSQELFHPRFVSEFCQDPWRTPFSETQVERFREDMLRALQDPICLRDAGYAQVELWRWDPNPREQRDEAVGEDNSLLDEEKPVIGPQIFYPNFHNGGSAWFSPAMILQEAGYVQTVRLGMRNPRTEEIETGSLIGIVTRTGAEYIRSWLEPTNDVYQTGISINDGSSKRVVPAVGADRDPLR